jgi:hypothetical protein
MNPKYLICSLTAAALLTPASVGVVRIEGSQHLSHTAGPLPDAVRQATERFLDVKEAIRAKYVEFGGCVSGQEEGAMGVHYVNPELFDGQLDVAEPEALVYEPNKNGRLVLVAVEYITPAALWHARNPGVQPALMGHLFHFVAGPNRYGSDTFYELHVWAWKNNRRGAFSDWNPNVSSADWVGTTF